MVDSSLQQNLQQLLSAIAGAVPLEPDDAAWRVFNTLPQRLSKVDPQQLHTTCGPYWTLLVVHDPSTGNYHKFLQRTTALLRAATTPSACVPATNAVALLASCLQHVTEKLEPQVLASFATGARAAKHSSKTGAAFVECTLQVVETLATGDTLDAWTDRLHTLVYTACTSCLFSLSACLLFHWRRDGRTYTLLLQLVQLLVTLCSSQLYTTAPAGPWGAHPLVDTLLTHPSIAPQVTRLVEALLKFVISRPLPPRDADAAAKEMPSEAARVSSLGRATPRAKLPLSSSPLAHTSLLLLLALMHHTLLPKHADSVNPVQLQLRHLHDSAESSSQLRQSAAVHAAPSASSGAAGDAGAPPADQRENGAAGMHRAGYADEERGFAGLQGPSVSFSALFEAFGSIAVDEPGTLLLYALLRQCPQFKEYILVRSDLDTLLLPILELLYKQQALESNHMYMLLIVLLILSQEPSFSENVHKALLNAVPWYVSAFNGGCSEYQERTVTKSTLGSLTIVVLCRTAQGNLFKHKDAYLHTSTLAALTNMAPHITNLTSLAAQRILTLTEMLAKHYQRLLAQQQHMTVGTTQATKAEQPGRTAAVSKCFNMRCHHSVGNSNVRGSPPLGAIPSAEEASSSGDVEVFGNCLRMMLEIINIALLHGLQHNPELLYAIMHKQDLFTALHADPQFNELGHNIQCVYEYFNPKLDAARENRTDWTVESVHEILKKELQKWRPGKLHQFPDLRFTYEEEAAPEEFFVPYVWSLVVEGLQVSYNPKAIALFSPSNPHTSPWKQGPSNASPASRAT